MKGIPFFIALRFLSGKKSHKAVNATAIVSVVGVVVATAAVVCVLSVFNGFQSILTGRLDFLAPDLLISPASGKTIADADSLVAVVSEVKDVHIATPTLTDNALAYYGGRETPVSLKGIVPQDYSKVTSIDSLLIAKGNTICNSLADNPCLISVGVAYKLDIFQTGIVFNVFAPKRLGRFNPANPAAAFVMDSLFVADIFQSLQEEYDENTIFTDIATVRNLLLYDNEATAVEVSIRPDADLSIVRQRVQAAVGSRFVVSDRLMQQQLSFRMVQIEKWMTFLLLFFILIIASFNIITTLSMFVLEKSGNLRTLSAIGLSRNAIARVFMWESVIVSAIGSVGGIILGTILCLLQENFGFISIANGSIDGASVPYPVALEVSDIFITLVPIFCISLICAAVAAAFAKSRIK